MAATLLRRRHHPEVRDLAVRAWVIAPGERSMSSRAAHLPGQLERVTGWQWMDEHPAREMAGGRELVHAPTRGFLVRDAWLLDGVLYKGRACTHLQPRSHWVPRLRAEAVVDRAAVHCTYIGNRYFGNWMSDDCAAYPLALAEGTPVTTTRPLPRHVIDYLDWFEMQPRPHRAAFCRELVVFDDLGQNSDKRRRFRALGERLRARVEACSHPGVFLLRGATGQRRVLVNEQAIAERLRDRRGFRILDTSAAQVAEIVRTCAGARVVAGVEGSQLMHGYVLLQPGDTLFALQPPDRFVSYYKHVGDRDGVRFAFVVGTPREKGFYVDAEEVERTLDLVEATRR